MLLNGNAPAEDHTFPYTTLFRSSNSASGLMLASSRAGTARIGLESACYAEDMRHFLRDAFRLLRPGGRKASRRKWRSEEHTSELQSRQYLVCRLLLEKKKIQDQR